MLTFDLFRQHHVAIHMPLIHTTSIKDPLCTHNLRLISLKKKKKSNESGIDFSPSVWIVEPNTGADHLYITGYAMTTCFILKKHNVEIPPFHQLLMYSIKYPLNAMVTSVGQMPNSSYTDKKDMLQAMTMPHNVKPDVSTSVLRNYTVLICQCGIKILTG